MRPEQYHLSQLIWQGPRIPRCLRVARAALRAAPNEKSFLVCPCSWLGLATQHSSPCETCGNQAGSDVLGCVPGWGSDCSKIAPNKPGSGIANRTERSNATMPGAKLAVRTEQEATIVPMPCFRRHDRSSTSGVAGHQREWRFGPRRGRDLEEGSLYAAPKNASLMDPQRSTPGVGRATDWKTSFLKKPGF